MMEGYCPKAPTVINVNRASLLRSKYLLTICTLLCESQSTRMLTFPTIPVVLHFARKFVSTC